MLNSFVYWRATHPLVYISVHLLLGLGIASVLPKLENEPALNLAIIILVISIIYLLIVTYKSSKHDAFTMINSLVLISWGICIKWAFQSKNYFHIPYPENTIISARQWMIQKVSENIKNHEAKGFALAILIGIKSDMDKLLVNAYIQLGIIHIIAISGMHLEILFKNLSSITQLLPRQKVYIWIELIILLLSAWTYALIAFGSPSIIRASIFFSIYIIGKFMETPSFMLNTIAAGILLLLLFDHDKISNIGLQLSYAAVMGIHLFYKPIYKMLSIDNPIIKFLWSNCCISLSAQIATLPILAFHFHQIAGWVLVTNFIMVPLSNIILYGLGILLMLPAQFSIASYWGSLIEKYIHFFNVLVTNWFKQTQAGNVIIQMNHFDLIIYYAILLFIYLWLYLKQSIYLIWVLGFICLYVLMKLFS
jgi:competence protein ComEC